MAGARPSTPGPTFVYEQAAWATGARTVGGVDECGRGPLCGVVQSACVVLAADAQFEALQWARDSKALSEKKIATYAAAIRAGTYRDAGLVAWGLGHATPEEIDRVNIRIATITAMQRAVAAAEAMLGAPIDALLVDGVPLKELGRPHTAIVKGDALSVAIALSSIVGKDERDRHMVTLSEQYPQYACWAQDAGYGSPAHLEALRTHGPIPGVHRFTFAPIKHMGTATR